MDSDMENDKKPEMERRTFLRKVGITALATAWAAPIIQTVSASPAAALTTPREHTTTTPGPSTPSTD
jgi:hypothetical protein